MSTKVQRITGTLSAAQTTIDVPIPEPISSLTKAFLSNPHSLQSAGIGRQASGASSDGQYWGVTPEIIATDTVRFTRAAATTNESCDCAVDLVEDVGQAGGPNEFFVRGRASMQFSSSATSKTSAAIAGVTDITRCVPFGFSRPNTSGLNAQQWLCEFNVELSGADVVVVARRSSGSAGQPFTPYELVEFTGSNWDITSLGVLQPSADNVEQAFTIAPVQSIQKTWVHGYLMPHSGLASAAADTWYAQLLSPTSLALRFKDLGSQTAARLFLIENPDMTVQVLGAPNGTDDWAAGSSPQTETLTIAAVDTARTITVLRAGSSGTSPTDHPAAQWRSRLASATSFEAFRGKSVGGSEYVATVIQLPNTDGPVNTPVIIGAGTVSAELGAAGSLSGSGFKAVQGTGSFKINGVTCTIGAWADDAVAYTVPTTLRYGPAVGVLTNSDGEVDFIDIDIIPSAGFKYVDLVAPLAPSAQRAHAATGEAIAGGMQQRMSAVTGTGVDIDDVIVYQDGRFQVRTAVTKFKAEVHNGTDWGTGADQTIAGTAAPVFDGPNIGDQAYVSGSAITSADYSSRFSDADSSLTFSLGGGAIPGLSLSSAGVLSGTPTTPGSYPGRYVIATETTSPNTPVNSNPFSVTVTAPGPAPTTSGNMGPMIFAYPSPYASLTYRAGQHLPGATSFSISPALPAGMTLDTATGDITVVPTGLATHGPFTLTGHNGNGSTSLPAFSIRVVPSTFRGFLRALRLVGLGF